MVRLTSLLLVEERLLEAEYFARRLQYHSNSEYFHYDLHAFVSAARSVWYVADRQLASAPGFRDWWRTHKTFTKDAAVIFFRGLRHFSQKEGRVSVAGTTFGKGARRRWTYRFAGNDQRVPEELRDRDVAECCRAHVAKLAHVVLECIERFPYHSCPTKALTPDGLGALGLSLEDLEGAAELTEARQDTTLTREERLRLLRDYCVDGVDIHTIERLAKWRPRSKRRYADQDPFAAQLLGGLVGQLEGPDRRADYPQLFGRLFLKAVPQRKV